MNTEALLPRLRASFQTCAPVPHRSDTIRCEHLYNDRPRSIYFFQAVAALPSEAELSRIHEKIISPSYFYAQGPSRWSHYFVFVTDDQGEGRPGFRERRREIEDNKDYARKFVIYDSDLENFLDHSIGQPASAASASAIANIWSARLHAAGLERIQSQDSRASLIRNIREGTVKPSVDRLPKAKVNGVDPAVPQIQSFEVKKFGDRKICGAFNFGQVNLIRGPNGSGKTSLLEAIEHYFCGATVRSGGAASALVASAGFNTGKAPVPYRVRSNEEYHAMDLRWYGRTTTRGNRLFEGFSRFNFLNTDAAVQFSTDRDQRDLTEVLSKIALGPDASYTWTRIGQFADEIEQEVRGLDRTHQTLSQNIGAADSRLLALKSASPQSEALWAHTQLALDALGWPSLGLPMGGPDAQWFMQFRGLRSFVAASAEIGAASSAEEIRLLLLDTDRDIERIGKTQAESGALMRRAAELHKRRLALQQSRERLLRLRQYVLADFPSLLRSREQLTTKLAGLAGTLVPEPDRIDFLQVSTELDCDRESLAEFERAVTTRLAQIRVELEMVERQRAAQTQRLSETEAVVADLRGLGRKYVHLQADAGECPLCHTHMAMAELVPRIEGASDWSGQGLVLESLASKVVELNREVQRMSCVLVTTKRVAGPVSGVGNNTVAAVAEGMQGVKTEMEECAAQISQINSRLASMGSSSFGSEEYLSLVGEIRTAESPNISNIDAALLEQERIESDVKGDEKALGTSQAELSAEYAAIVGKYNAEADEELATRLRARSVSLLGTINDFAELPALLSQRFANDVQSLLRLGSRATKCIDDLNTQVQADRARLKEIGVLQEQTTREREQLATISAQRGRLRAALDVLQDLRVNHSLDAGLRAFLSENMDAIQRVFTKIHMPQELRLSNLGNCKLTRVGAEGEVDLTEISSGQRAALMLSIFLTLNFSLRSGPPLMLIDDPIAHIDDLNALSFLDFLADVAESKRRQIFFATANEKLANVFQKKMEFLDSEFKTTAMARQ